MHSAIRRSRVMAISSLISASSACRAAGTLVELSQDPLQAFAFGYDAEVSIHVPRGIPTLIAPFVDFFLHGYPVCVRYLANSGVIASAFWKISE